MATGSQRGEATRERLIATARDQFGRLGYEAASIEAILNAAGVSRGALYHHFPDKEALFLAVLEVVEADIAAAVVVAAREERDPAKRLRAGCMAWLQLAQDSEVQQIALIDAPAVVGWEAWRRIDEEHFLSQLKQGIDALALAGHFPSQLVDPVSHILLAALNEAALYAACENNGASFRLAETAVDELLNRLLGGEERHSTPGRPSVPPAKR